MDIEKLIDRLGENTDCWTDKVYGYADLRLDAATTLSTLQAENERLRKELEYEREHANAYHEECGQWEAENAKLRAELEQVKQERDEAVECINTVYSYILIKRKTDAVRTIEKWLRGQKED